MAGTTYDMVGKIKVMFEPMSFASGFNKREFVLILEDDYPQDIKFVCVKEKCAQLDSVVVTDGGLIPCRPFVLPHPCWQLFLLRPRVHLISCFGRSVEQWFQGVALSFVFG